MNTVVRATGYNDLEIQLIVRRVYLFLLFNLSSLIPGERHDHRLIARDDMVGQPRHVPWRLSYTGHTDEGQVSDADIFSERQNAAGHSEAEQEARYTPLSCTNTSFRAPASTNNHLCCWPRAPSSYYSTPSTTPPNLHVGQQCCQIC